MGTSGGGVNRVFLSHSSKDKGSYVDVVARRLGDQNIEYDAVTFEEGENTLEEIQKRIDKCDLFALFISSEALDSPWVQGEIERAHKLLGAKVIKKFYPIIIDPSVTYADPRLPEWISREYNLKLVSRPAVTARRIEAKLRQLHWDSNPKSQERRRILVGRNELVREFENRIDDIDLPKPTCVIASGLAGIGRSTFLQHALSKASLVEVSYEPVKLVLEREDSIEDLILKLNDTGLTAQDNSRLENLLNKPIEQKTRILAEMLSEIRKAREVIFLEDRGCIVSHSKEIADWFAAAIESLGEGPRPVACIAAKYRVNPVFTRRHPGFYSVEVPELSPRERSGLLRRILDLHEFAISPDDFAFFAEQLKGYPEEAIYCANLILDLGVARAKQASHLITEFNSERASLLLRQYEGNSDAIDFIYLLSEFEFVGVSFLYEIVEEERYAPLLEELVTNLICDYVGPEKEYVRVNDTIRDLVRRNRLELPPQFAEKLRVHVKHFVQDSDKFERDSADFFYSIKNALAQGLEIDSRYLAPSHILRTIKDLYFSRENSKRLIMLADMLLEKEAFLDKKVIEDARYYLCLGLARQKDKRVLKEVMNISGPEHDFVLGYYYRLTGRHKDALDRLTKLLDKPYIASRAKRELVLVYQYVEEFDKAAEMAKDNYLANRGNQYPIQSYLICLLNAENYMAHKGKIQTLISELGDIGSQQSREMALIAEAMYESKFNNNRAAAYERIDQARGVQGSHYPLLAKFDIALRFRDMDAMRETLAELKALQKVKTFSSNTIVKNEAFYLASTGQLAEAKALLKTGLENYPAESITKIEAKLQSVFDARPR